MKSKKLREIKQINLQNIYIIFILAYIKVIFGYCDFNMEWEWY